MTFIIKTTNELKELSDIELYDYYYIVMSSNNNYNQLKLIRVEMENRTPPIKYHCLFLDRMKRKITSENIKQ